MSTHTHGEKHAPPTRDPSHESHMDEAVDVGLGGGTFADVQPQKVCCVCSVNLKGKERYKDASGRYWCMKCGDADHVKKHQNDVAPCPECHGSFTNATLVDFNGKRICEPCRHKHELAAKREKARIAAAEEEARRQAVLHKRLTIGGVAFATAAVTYFVVQMLSGG